MTTNESFFFRDDKPFQHFRAQALPRMLASRPAGAPLRVWSAASSSGQEAYSIAMIISECRAGIGDRRIEIIGTDLAHDQVQRARDGTYTQFEVQRGLPVQMLMRHFRKEENGWRISEAIRGMVQYPRVESVGRFAAARAIRRGVLSQRADLFRSADQGEGAGCRCTADAGGWVVVSRWRGDGAGDHQQVRAFAGRARGLWGGRREVHHRHTEIKECRMNRSPRSASHADSSHVSPF